MKKIISSLFVAQTVLLVVFLVGCAVSPAGEEPVKCNASIADCDPEPEPVPTPIIEKTPWTEAECVSEGGNWLNGDCWWLGEMGLSDESALFESAYISEEGEGQYSLAVEYNAKKTFADHEEMHLPNVFFKVPLTVSEKNENVSVTIGKRYPLQDIKFNKLENLAGARVEVGLTVKSGSFTATGATYDMPKKVAYCYDNNFDEAVKESSIGDFNGTLDIDGEIDVKIYTWKSKNDIKQGLDVKELTVPFTFTRYFNLLVLPSMYNVCACSAGGGGQC